MNKNYIYIALGLFGLYLLGKTKEDREEVTQERAGSGLLADKDSEGKEPVGVKIKDEEIDFVTEEDFGEF